MGEVTTVAAPVTVHRLLQPAPSPHSHTGGRGEDEAHWGPVHTPEKMEVRREDGEKATATPLNIPRLPQPAPSLQLHARGGHRGRFASRNAAPVPPRDGPLDYYQPVYCKCNEQCFKLISWEVGYQGRRYYRCCYEWVICYICFHESMDQCWDVFELMKLTWWWHVFDLFLN